jgi:hypothetical protein
LVDAQPLQPHSTSALFLTVILAANILKASHGENACGELQGTVNCRSIAAIFCKIGFPLPKMSDFWAGILSHLRLFS